VAVSLDGNVIYTQKIFVSAGENKVIELWKLLGCF
jgi:hypothetical protein